MDYRHDMAYPQLYKKAQAACFVKALSLFFSLYGTPPEKKAESGRIVLIY